MTGATTPFQAPLWTLLRSREEFGASGLPLLTVISDSGVEVRDLAGGRAPSEELSKYRVVRTGDLVVNKLWARFGAYGVAKVEGVISPAYWVLTIDKRVFPRYLHYLLRSSPYRAEIWRLSKDLPPNGFDLPWQHFRNIRVLVPPMEEQRRLVEVLDSEMARIEGLLSKKRRMTDLLRERMWAAVAREIGAVNAPSVPLRRYLHRIVDGPFGSSLTSAHYTEEGARVVRLGNIGFGHFKDADAAFISPAHYLTLQRHQVRQGDLLIAGLGDARNHVGRACVAPDLGPAVVKADCYCATVDTARASAGFLSLFLSSPLGADSVAVAARGTTRSRINLDIAKEVLVPLMSLDAQHRLCRMADQWRAQADIGKVLLERQVSLLEEHRDALVTAVVTGSAASGATAA